MVLENKKADEMKPPLYSGSLGVIDYLSLQHMSSRYRTLSPCLVDGHLKVNTTSTSTNIVNSAEPQMNRSSSSLFDTF